MTQVNTTNTPNWKNESATEKQMAFIRKLAKATCGEALLDGVTFTKGEASDLIEKLRTLRGVTYSHSCYIVSDINIINDLCDQIDKVVERAKQREAA